jgi:hypothetical protein
MIALKGYDGSEVKFTEEEARQIPYVADIVKPEEWDTDFSLDAPCLSGTQLRLLKSALHFKQSASFLPSDGTFLVGSTRLPAPPFACLTWTSLPLDEFFHILDESEILLLLTTAEFCCMWDLRTGLLCLILHRILMKGCTFTSFFQPRYDRFHKQLVDLYHQRLAQ